MKTVLTISLLAVSAFPIAAQEPAPDPDLQQQYELSQAMSEAGSSPIDVIHALEAHLKKYPATKQRAGIEQQLAKSAIDTDDSARIILYGERVIASMAKDDMTLIDRLTRALLNSSDPDDAKKALMYAKRYEGDVLALRAQSPPGHLTAGQWSDETDIAMARALALEARATGDTEGAEAAAKVAVKSWEAYPTGEGARELAYWLIKLERNREAIEYYADAFALADPVTTAADRARDRKRLGELYSKLNGSEKGLGDAVLEAYDRTSTLMSDRRARLQARDPNAVASNIEDFVLPAVEGGTPPVSMSSLKGKTVVLDFWATWCGPCLAQEPLIENVKRHFGDAKDVVFMAVDTDDDLSLAAPFVKEKGWKSAGYFEAGLSQHLVISAIPTVVVLDPSGRVSSKLTGFIPQRFEQMLTERIEDARKNQ